MGVYIQEMELTMLRQILNWFTESRTDQEVWDACLLTGGRNENGESTALRVEAKDLGFEPGTPDWYVMCGYSVWLDSLDSDPGFGDSAR